MEDTIQVWHVLASMFYAFCVGMLVQAYLYEKKGKKK